MVAQNNAEASAEMKRTAVWAQTRQAGTTPFANICLIPLNACLVRSSFSMRAKRTWLSP
jgi:hypothetical protein